MAGISETEATVYAEIGDMHGLDLCDSREEHLQIDNRLETKQTIRVRRTKFAGDISHDLTLKRNIGAVGNINRRKEYPTPITADFFKGFALCAQKAQVKTRYIYKSKNVSLTFMKGDLKKVVILPEVKYEVDVFEKEDGSISKYCKIDLEVDSINKFLAVAEPEIRKYNLCLRVSHLPFKPKNCVISTDQTKKQYFDEVWKEFNRSIKSIEHLLDSQAT